MRWLARLFAHTFVRRVVYVLVGLLLAAVGLGQAHAGNPITVCGKQYAYGGAPTSDTHQGLEEAAAHCAAEPSQYIEIAGQTHHLVYNQSQGCTVVGSTIRKRYARGAVRIDANTCQTYNDGPNDGYQATAMTHAFTDQCPSGTTWDPVSATCFSEAKCLAHNSEPGFAGVGEINTNFKSACVGGCEYKPVPGTPVISSGSGADLLVTADFEFSGKACPSTNPPPTVTPEEAKPTDPQRCVTYGTGQKFCQKSDGTQCYTTSNNRQHCWKPGETGEKTDGPYKQKRDAGPTEIPPNLNLPNGDTLSKTGESKTVTTTIYGGGSSTTQTITTTTTNYITNNGTNAGTSDQGEPADGSGSPEGGEGEGTSATGGADCKTPPVVTGDAALNMVANQAWATRCAVKAGNAVKVTGNLEDCSQPYTVEGDTAGMSEGENRLGVEQLRALRKQYCGDQAGDSFDVEGFAQGVVDGVAGAPENGDGAWTNGSKATGGFDEGEGPDDTGLGFTRTCPQLPTVEVLGKSIDFNSAIGTKLCDWIGLGGYFVLVLASIVSVRILAGGAN